MSGIQFKPTVVDPELSDLLANIKKDIFLNLNCHAIGTVQSVNYDAQTLVATINYTKTFYVLNRSSGNFDPVQENYPPLLDVPFVILGGGSCSLTFPIAQGDQCLIFFNDRDIDNWATGANSGPVNSNRLHSLSDAIALVGLRAHVDSYDTDRAVLQNGTTFVGVGASKVKIANNSTSLGPILTGLASGLSSTATALTLGGQTGAGTALAAAAAALNSLAGSLLE